MSTMKKLSGLQITICLINISLLIGVIISFIFALARDVAASVGGSGIPEEERHSIVEVLTNVGSATVVLVGVSAILITVIGIVQVVISIKTTNEGKAKMIVAGAMGIIATIPFAIIATFIANVVVVADRKI